jgi:hypothetical protein
MPRERPPDHSRRKIRQALVGLTIAAGIVGAMIAAPTSRATSARERSPRLLSRYAELTRVRMVNRSLALLRTTITLRQPESVYVQSDGTYRPRSLSSAADVYITVDGRKVTNDALIDWRAGEGHSAHPFNAAGSAALVRGRHTIELRARPPRLAACVVAAIEDCNRKVNDGSGAGPFEVLAGANLSVFVHPAAHVISERLPADRGPFNFDTSGYFTTDTHLTKPLPLTPLLHSVVPAGERAVALGSGWLYPEGPAGDAMLALLLDGRFPGDDVASWGNTDLFFGAELRAPVSVQEFISASSAPQEVALGTIEFPWMPTWVPGVPENPVIYWVARDTTMTILSGGLRVAGVAGGPDDISPDPQPPALVGGSREGVPTGTNVQLTSRVIRIPRGNAGIIFVSGKVLDQGGGGFDASPAKGTLSLWLTINGKRVGPRVRQQVSAPDAGSGRTMATSYLAMGRARLKPGRYRLQLWGRSDGPFLQAWMWPNAALMWFD